MIEFLKNIIPRIQQYSKGLDKIELLVGPKKPWIYKDENGAEHQYIFLKDSTLIMIANGVSKTGKWSILPTDQLFIDLHIEKLTFDHLFIENALLILQLSGTDNEPFVLINKEQIPDLDYLTFLKLYEEQKNGKTEEKQTEKRDYPPLELNDDDKFVVIALIFLFIILVTLGIFFNS